jgi:hypothetical protein
MTSSQILPDFAHPLEWIVSFWSVLTQPEQPRFRLIRSGLSSSQSMTYYMGSRVLGVAVVV